MITPDAFSLKWAITLPATAQASDININGMKFHPALFQKNIVPHSIEAKIQHPMLVFVRSEEVLR